MKRTIVAIGVIVILAVILTATVLATAKPLTQNAIMTSISSEPTYNSGSTSTVSAEASDNSTLNISQDFVSDSLSTLTTNENFTKHGFSVKSVTEAVKVNTSSAFDIANKSVGNYCKDSKSITGVLAKLTDSETPQLPGTNIILDDYPVWIVTYHNVNINVGNSHTGYKTIHADSNVVIDANSGEVLFQFEYKTN